MSAFLGPIHFWLYNKIQLQLDRIELVLKLAEERGFSQLRENLDKKYGVSEKRSLEEVIDEGNIHGWLQEQVSRSEYKLAESVTSLLKQDKQLLGELEKLFYQKGYEEAERIEVAENLSLSAVYKYMIDSLLDGMPCDHAISVIEESDQQVVWQRNSCVHEPYWRAVEGNIKVYYLLREEWLKGFGKALGVEVTPLNEIGYCLKKEETNE